MRKLCAVLLWEAGMVRTTVLGVLVALMCGIAAHAVPITGTVDGKSNIFKALPGGGGDGIFP